MIRTISFLQFNYDNFRLLPDKGWLSAKWIILREFLKNYQQVAAIAPTPEIICQKIADEVDFNSAKTIVEFGAGTGVITEKLVEKLAPKSSLIIFEANATFVEILNKKFNQPNVKVIKAKAENFESHLSNLEIAESDVIISSIPLTFLSEQVKSKLLANCKEALSSNGKLIVLQYSMSALANLKRIFSVKVKFLPYAFPPYLLFIAKKENQNND